MTAHDDLRDGSTLADTRARLDAAFGWLISERVAGEAARYGKTVENLTRDERASLEDDVAPGVWALLCADDEQVQSWRDIATRQERGSGRTATTVYKPLPAGTRFGRLVVTADRQRGDTKVWARCDCGTELQVPVMSLRRANPTKSCGCAKARHGHFANGKPSPTYVSWQGMIERCCTVTASNYPRYGGVGVTVCDRWRESFEAFLADMGERQAGTTLDRIDGTRGYGPDNCRWADQATQSANRSWPRKQIARVKSEGA